MEKQEFTIEKSTVECYKIRHESGRYWADITVDVTSNTSGRIIISSDYGNYTNYWGACGCRFKQFLIDLNLEYAANKFGADRWFDIDRTTQGYKQKVCEYRRDETFTAEKARIIYDEIKELEECSNKSEFEISMWNQSNLMGMYDHCPDIYYGITPQFKKFWSNIWPIFINQLKNEILN